MKQSVGSAVFFLFFSLCCWSLAAPAARAADAAVTGDADLVWVESDGIRHEIFYSSFKDGAWRAPLQVTDDYFDNLHPVIDRDGKGRRWLFWTASDDGRLTLHYVVDDKGKWSEVKDVPTDLHSSIAPSIVIDDRDVLWLVWSGNTGTVDDIYWATLQDGKWSEPQTVHEKDDVPDILPKITLQDDGTLRVAWKKIIDGRYRKVESFQTDGQWSTPRVVEEKDSERAVPEKEKIPLPDFVRDDDRAFVRLY
jgi:hypothetical protein